MNDELFEKTQTPPTILRPLAWLMLGTPFVHSYSAPLVVPLMLAAALATILIGGRIMVSWPTQPAKWLAAWFFALALWSVLSSLWAVEPSLVFRTFLRCFGLFVVCLLFLRVVHRLEEPDRHRFGTFLLIGLLVGLINLQISLWTGGALRSWLQDFLHPLIGHQRPIIMPFALDSSMTLTGLLIWPCISVVMRRWGRGPALALYLFGLVVIAQGGSLTAVIAYLMGGGVFLIAFSLPRRITAGLAGIVALWMLVAPIFLQPTLTSGVTSAVPLSIGKVSSFQHRRVIWEFVIERIAERPLAGWGLGSSRAIPGGHDEVAPGIEKLPLHPHDAALQLWLELGLPGALLGCVFFVFLIRKIQAANMNRTDYSLTMALLAAAVINSMVSYNLWHEWWITFLILSACSLIAVVPDSERPRHD